MQIDKVIEDDIVTFLDEKQAATTEGTLKNITQLKKSLNENQEELKNKLEIAIHEYNNIEKNDPYKRIAFAKLKPSIIIIIQERKLDNHPLIENDLKRQVLNTENPPEKIELHEEDLNLQELQKQKNSINKSKQELMIIIKKGDVQEAIKLYRLLKAKFYELADDKTDYKKQLYSDMLSYYLQIKQLLRKPIKIEENKKTGNKNTINIEKLEKLIEETDKLANQRNFDEATRKVLDIKHDIEIIPKDHEVLKEELEKKANHILRQIYLLKKMDSRKKEEVS